MEFIDREGSIGAFARRVGATPQNVRNWAIGASSPSLEKIADIAAAYGLTPGALLESPGDRAATELLPEEAEVVALMRKMDGEGRAMVVRVTSALESSGAYRGQA